MHTGGAEVKGGWSNRGGVYLCAAGCKSAITKSEDSYMLSLQPDTQQTLLQFKDTFLPGQSTQGDRGVACGEVPNGGRGGWEEAHSVPTSEGPHPRTLKDMKRLQDRKLNLSFLSTLC